MPYRVTVNGIEVTCDTAEEAAHLAMSVARDRSVPRLIVPPVRRPVVSAPPRPGAPTSLTEERVRELHDIVKDSSQDRLVHLLATKDSVPAKELRDAFGFKTNNALAGVLAGLTKNATKVGITASLITAKWGDVDGDVDYIYSLRPEFRMLVKQVGWIK